MLGRVLGLAVQGEIDALRNRASGVAYFILAGALATAAVCCAALALFLGLSSIMPAWQAALLVSFAIGVLAALSWLLGRSYLRTRRPRLDLLGDAAMGLRQGERSSLPTSQSTMAVVLIAAATAGVLIGRRLIR